MRRRFAALPLLAGLLAGAAPTGPVPGSPRIIGTDSNGCIAGAVQLPEQGPGFEQIRMSRSTFWGAPSTIARLELLAREATAAGLPTLYMNDISAPRGGPLASHAGHEIGLEADVWLDVTPKTALSPAAREDLEPPSVVAADGQDVDPSIWRPGHATLIRLAAELPGVERLFVNPAIKRALCRQTTGDRSWLHLVRPWYGHASHVHIRFRCPADQPLCIDPPPPPAGDGCDATLAWWFEPHPAPPQHAPPKRPALPAACRAIMDAP